MAEESLDRIIDEIRQRKFQSREAYLETQRLQAALAALGQPESRTRARRRSTARRASKRSLRSRVPRGENVRKVRETIAERPGATAGEVAAATGVGRATAATTLGRLARDGELERTTLPSGRVGFRLAVQDQTDPQDDSEASVPNQPAAPETSNE